MTDHIAASAAEIVALINSSPRTPRVDEIATIIAKTAVTALVADSLLVAKAREIAARVSDAENLEDGEAADAAIEAAHAELQDLEAQIPRPARSFADLAARAWVAYLGGEGRPDGTLAEGEHGDIFEGPAARLVEDLLRFADRS